MKKYIDISIPISDRMMRWPNDPPISIKTAKSPSKGDRSLVTAIKMGSHAGTHVDAPKHFLPRSYGVDEIPAEILIGPCVVVDCRGVRAITAGEVERIPKDAKRILFRTDNSERLTKRKFFKDFVTLTPDAADALIARHAQLVGIDAFSVDPFLADNPVIHLRLLSRRIVIVETLYLHNVKAGAYELICLPLRLQKADGAPARVLLRRLSRQDRMPTPSQL